MKKQGSTTCVALRWYRREGGGRWQLTRSWRTFLQQNPCCLSIESSPLKSGRDLRKKSSVRSLGMSRPVSVACASYLADPFPNMTQRRTTAMHITVILRQIFSPFW